MKLAPEAQRDSAAWLDRIYRHALGRAPSDAETRPSPTKCSANPRSAEGVADFLWALVNLPEFQLIN